MANIDKNDLYNMKNGDFGRKVINRYPKYEDDILKLYEGLQKVEKGEYTYSDVNNLDFDNRVRVYNNGVSSGSLDYNIVYVSGDCETNFIGCDVLISEGDIEAGTMSYVEAVKSDKLVVEEWQGTKPSVSDVRQVEQKVDAEEMDEEEEMKERYQDDDEEEDEITEDDEGSDSVLESDSVDKIFNKLFGSFAKYYNRPPTKKGDKYLKEYVGGDLYKARMHVSNVPRDESENKGRWYVIDYKSDRKPEWLLGFKKYGIKSDYVDSSVSKITSSDVSVNRVKSEVNEWMNKNENSMVDWDSDEVVDEDEDENDEEKEDG